jgi:glycosyltransferase involved in cell wall biosynthesis
MPEPLVSVIINCYNGEKYLAQAVDSVLAQTYRNWEIIFWDNQSTDRSAQIARSYSDPRLKYFYAPSHTGLYEARNHAIAKAQGEFLAFLDVDDWWLPDKLTRQIPLFADPQVGLVCANYWVESERKRKRWLALRRPIPRGWALGELLRSYFIGLVTLVVRRSALDSLDYPFDARFAIGGDRDLAIRLSVTWKLGSASEPLAVYRLHGDNQIIRNRSQIHEELSFWIGQMEEVESVRSLPEFRFVKHQLTYLKAMHWLLEGDRRSACHLLPDLPWSQMKLRLCVAVLLPRSLVRRLKN